RSGWPIARVRIISGNSPLGLSDDPAGSFGNSPRDVVVMDDFIYSEPQAASLVLPIGNAIDNPQFFVRQQFLDFLNREPDAATFNSLVNQITACGSDT